MTDIEKKLELGYPLDIWHVYTYDRDVFVYAYSIEHALGQALTHWKNRPLGLFVAVGNINLGWYKHIDSKIVLDYPRYPLLKYNREETKYPIDLRWKMFQYLKKYMKSKQQGKKKGVNKPLSPVLKGKRSAKITF